MFWDDLVRRWRREARARDPRMLRAAGGHVAVLPAPQRVRQSRPLLLGLLVLAALALRLAFGSGRVQVVTSTVATPAPTVVDPGG